MVPSRIAYVVKIFPKLSETFIASELTELRRRGIELQILSLLPPREELHHQFIASAGLDQVLSYEPKDFSRILREFRPQLLHAHFATEATATARELAQKLAIPFTFTAHGYDIHRKPPADFAARASAAKAVVTVSQANAAYIANKFSVPSSHIRVIPCGVDIAKFRPHSGNSHLNNPPLILCVARQVPVKNLDLLLQSCALLHERGVNFRCVLIGDGACRSQLQQTCARLDLSSSVSMPGAAAQEQVLQWWQQASLGVLTSDNEG